MINFNNTFYPLVMCLLMSTLTLAQQGQQNLPWDIWLNPTTRNFDTIVAQAEAWFEGQDKGRGTGYKQWKRWEEFNSTRLMGDGRITNVAARNYFAYRRQRSRNQGQGQMRNVSGDWNPYSATAYENVGSWSPGIGRINEIAFHPSDANTIFVGTPAGGLFKTTNHGTTWTCLTDTLSSIGVSGIAIHPTDPDMIYILTGDGDGGHTRSIGVYKSTDGGQTWNATGLTWDLDDNVRGRKIMLEPGFPSWILVAASNGLWQSTDSGVNWTERVSGNFSDIEYKPGDPTTVYASSANALYKSINYGQSWSIEHTNTSTRIQIAVTPAADSLVYLLAGPSNIVVAGGTPPDTLNGFRGVFRSTNSGDDFALIRNTPNVLSSSFSGGDLRHQTTYDLAIAAAPDSATLMHLGGVNVWKYNAGGTPTMNGYWNINGAASNNVEYVHADIHKLIYSPLNGRLYAGTDGGIFYTDDYGDNWTDITGGLNISQLYHFAGTEQDIDFMVGGMQDNGTAIFTENDTMKSLLGADGTDVLIHPTNKNIIYAQTQRGNLRKSVDGGQSFSNIVPFQDGDDNPGPFITRLAMDMNHPDTIYVGWTNDTIYRTFDGGSSWSKFVMPGDSRNVVSISVGPNSATVYAATGARAFRSTNYGATWTQIYAPTSGAAITSITSFAQNHLRAIITRGGFDATTPRVLQYINSTGTVTPLTGTGGSPGQLPQVPANISALHADELMDVYVGTDIGVYYYSEYNSDAGWQKFKNGLPNVPVRDIEIYEDQGIMRIATFGRGIWQSDVWDDCEYEKILTQGNDPDNGMPTFQFHEAADFIYSSREVAGSDGDVTYKAGDAVLLETGFLATEGNKFIAGTKPCGIDLGSVGPDEPPVMTSLTEEYNDQNEKTEKIRVEAEKDK